jgi:sentrin-specific protease 1
MQHKKSQPFDADGWKLVPTAPGTPQQENGSDCGVFTCIFADYLSRNEVRLLVGSAFLPSD